ncbi:MAG: flagellar FlbD family protein [Lachnospiraceae bacterium]|nr:flagellar FlbD family protein [Lachnospiraceae bacterium]
MIELTKLNDVKFTLNADIIEVVEETPDTVVTLTTGHKIIVKESRQEVTNLVKLYRKGLYEDIIKQIREL